MPQCQQLDGIVKTPLVEQTSASDVQSEQVGMKKGEALTFWSMPRLLNDKLSFWTLRSVGRSAVRKNGGT
ncbi:MAG: hypothetical protein EGR35_04115 [Collinsella aerofaciens]|nr:hypothetical protein [Collinsella aerofaciens]